MSKLEFKIPSYDNRGNEAELHLKPILNHNILNYSDDFFYNCIRRDEIR